MIIIFKLNDVVQIVPEHEFGGLFAVIHEITEFKSTGNKILKCYIPSHEGLIYIRLEENECERIGESKFIIEN